MTNSQQPTVFVIDDEASVRDTLGAMLSDYGFQVQTFESADAFLADSTGARIGCIVADVRMPGMDGIEMVRELARRNLALPVVLISGYADVPMAVAAIKAGADDVIEKPISGVQLVAAVNRCLPRALQQQGEKSIDPLEARFARLTPRQAEIFDLVAEGLTSQQIAARLKISPRTVESYRAEVMEKMQASGVAVLVRQAIRLNRMTP